MTSTNNNPTRSRSRYGDVFSFFAFVLSVALALQAYSEINRYAALRSDGVLVQGQWIDDYTEAATKAHIVIYSYVVNERTYRNRQVAPEGLAQDIDSGDPVDVVYLPEDPEMARIVGEEGYSKTYLVQLVVSILVAVFSLQHFIAFKMGGTGWIVKLIEYIQEKNRTARLNSPQ